MTSKPPRSLYRKKLLGAEEGLLVYSGNENSLSQHSLLRKDKKDLRKCRENRVILHGFLAVCSLSHPRELNSRFFTTLFILTS